MSGTHSLLNVEMSPPLLQVEAHLPLEHHCTLPATQGGAAEEGGGADDLQYCDLLTANYTSCHYSEDVCRWKTKRHVNILFIGFVKQKLGILSFQRGAIVFVVDIGGLLLIL